MLRAHFLHPSLQQYLLLLHQPTFVRHHWVHRRRQDGKCRHCGKVRGLPKEVSWPDAHWTWAVAPEPTLCVQCGLSVTVSPEC